MPFVIDLDPVAFSLFGIPVRWYGLILVGAAAVAIWLAQREGRRRGIEAQVVSDAVIWVGGAALVGGRVLYVVQNELGSLAEHPTLEADPERYLVGHAAGCCNGEHEHSPASEWRCD